MKIGILTFHDANNYGAVLQAYALTEAVKKIESDVEIINYKQPQIIKKRKIFSINTQNVISIIRSIGSSLLYFYPRLLKKICFNNFRIKYMNISKDYYFHSTDIERKDIYIVGSDQIWNSEITSNDATYFLNFCSEKQKKISYAASIGKDTISNEEREFLKENIGAIDCISVRENTAVEIIKQITDKPVCHVLDPTLLVDKEMWEKLIEREIINDKYLLIYKASVDEEVLHIAERISKKLNMKVLYINNSIRKNNYGFINIRRVDPVRFVSLFKNASYIVTNSFHGTAFSIIFNKNFVTIPHKTWGTRMVSLLNSLKLENRIVTNSNQIDEEFDLNIDYSEANTILEEEKKKSFEFLRSAIKGENK